MQPRPLTQTALQLQPPSQDGTHRSAAGAAQVPVSYGVQAGEHCPQCDQPWNESAQFCGECGWGSTCPQCHAPCNGFDFCESCGQWLLEGQCKLCYEPLQSADSFCASCGCQHNGFWCSHCQSASPYDFCSGCGDALSPRAQSMLTTLWAPTGDVEWDEALKSLELHTQAEHHNRLIAEPASLAGDVSPALEGSEYIDTSITSEIEQEDSVIFDDDDDVLVALTHPDPAVASSTVNQRKKLRWGGKSSLSESDAAQEAEPAFKPQQSLVLVSLESVAEIKDEIHADASGGKTFREMVHVREQARLDALEAKRQAEESARIAAKKAVVRAVAAILQQTLNKRFRTHQEARAFYQQIRHMLRAAGAHLHGWRCNYANYVHISPNDCACPGMGGEWIWKVA